MSTKAATSSASPTSSTSSKVSDAIKNYISLKAKYEKKYKNTLKQIRNSGLSMNAKKKKMKSLKIKCVNSNCNNSKGTKFETKGQRLLASCGDTNAPCNLDIDIDRGIYIYLPDILKSARVDLNTSKTGIIELKLDILFGLATEEAVAEQFENLKKKYYELETILSNLHSIIIENNMISINNAEGDDEVVSKDIFIETETIKLENLINKFRLLVREAEQETSISTVQYFADAIQLYIDRILPLLENIQKNKYQIQTVIENEEVFTLIQIKTTLNKKEIELEPQKVITNKK
jgi:hypothetical protein